MIAVNRLITKRRLDVATFFASAVIFALITFEIILREGEVDKQTEEELGKRAEEVILLGNEKVFLFKKCG